MWLPCPYLGRDVELTDEREWHIQRAHPPLLPDFSELLTKTIEDPDFVGDRAGREEIGFGSFWPEFLGGRSIVAVVLRDEAPTGGDVRY